MKVKRSEMMNRYILRPQQGMNTDEKPVKEIGKFRCSKAPLPTKLKHQW